MVALPAVELPDFPSFVPLLQQLGFGGVAGLVAGYALKKVGKVLAVVLGLFFLGLQLLAWSGYVSIDWGRVQADAEPWFAGDSLQESWATLLSVLTYNVPFAAAFVPGFLLGLRRG